MVQPNNILKRQEEIQMLIAEDNVRHAAKRMLDFVRDFSEDRADLNEIVVITSNYNRLERNERNNLIEFREAGVQRNKILFHMLEFIDALVDRLSLQRGMA